jgi:hypothetical protein
MFMVYRTYRYRTYAHYVPAGMSPDEVQAAALYLNNLGVIVHFRESISTRDVVIIDPQFLTKVRRTNARMRLAPAAAAEWRTPGAHCACVHYPPPRTPVATICR